MVFLQRKRIYSIYSKNGFTLVEVIVATSIILVFLSAMLGAYNLYLQMALTNTEKVKATFLLEEGIEAMKLIRDTSWTSGIANLGNNTPYSLAFSGTAWSATTTHSYVDGVFERYVTLAAVERNASSEIVSSGGTVDADTRLITVTVSWNDRGATSTRSLSTYLTNIFNN